MSDALDGQEERLVSRRRWPSKRGARGVGRRTRGDSEGFPRLTNGRSPLFKPDVGPKMCIQIADNRFG